jgi:hypothetical protein
MLTHAKSCVVRGERSSPPRSVSGEDGISWSSLCEEYRRIAYMCTVIPINRLAALSTLVGEKVKRGEHCVAVQERRLANTTTACTKMHRLKALLLPILRILRDVKWLLEAVTCVVSYGWDVSGTASIASTQAEALAYLNGIR